MRVVALPLTIFLVFALVSSPARSLYPDQGKVIIATGLSMPPYIIEGGTRGLLSEIIISSLEAVDLDVDLTYRSNLEAFRDFQQYKVDAVINATTESFPSTYLSDVIIRFKNRIISLEENQIHIDQLEDLLNHSVIAFSAAHKLLGPEFSQLAAQHESYQELIKQSDQAQALLDGSVDTIVADELIFKYFRSQLIRSHPGNMQLRSPVIYHEVFPETRYRVAFHDEKLRDRFNTGYRMIRESGKLDRIHRRYENLLNSFLF